MRLITSVFGQGLWGASTIFFTGSFGKRRGLLGNGRGRRKTNRYQGDVFMVEDDEIEDTEGDGLALA